MDAGLTLKPHRDKTAAGTAAAFRRGRAAVLGFGVPCPRLAVRLLYGAYGGLLHAAEVWATAAPAYRATIRGGLHQAACMVLGVSRTRVPAVFALAELGLLPPTVALYTQRVCFLASIQVMPPDRAVRHAFETSYALLEHHRSGGSAPAGTWAVDMAKVCAEVGISDLLDRPDEWLTRNVVVTGPPMRGTSTVRQKWPGRGGVANLKAQQVWTAAARGAARRAVRAWGVREWRAAVQTHPGLSDYLSIHPAPKMALYLTLATALPTGTRLRYRLRAGVYPVAATVQRRAAAEGRTASPACLLCEAPTETGIHAVLQCARLEAVRGDVGAAVTAACGASGQALLERVQQTRPASWRDVLWRLCLGGGVAPAGDTAPGTLSRADRLAVYAVTARVLREVLRERVRLLIEGQHVPEGDRPAWRVYPEFATRL